MGQRALITGASAGLGAEFARQLAAQGTNLVLVARRAEKLEALASEIRDGFGVSVDIVPADLSQPDAVDSIVAALGEQPIHYLINNAGSAGPTLLDQGAWPDHDNYLRLMLTSVAELCHKLIPGMTGQGFGRVVNVSSVAGRIPRTGDTSYGPMKSYLVALSEGLHMTVKSKGVHVSALCPGFTHTDFHAEGDLAKMKAATPNFIWYDAETVVREGLRAVERGKSVYVSGRLYRWLDPLLQWPVSRALLKRFV